MVVAFRANRSNVSVGPRVGRHGSLYKAEQVLTHVLEREPQNTLALANLALVLDRQGRVPDSAVLYRKLAQLEGHAPFHFFNLGMAAMEVGDFKAAADHFAREVERSPHYHESHFWLGVAYLRLGDIKAARTHLVLALENSTTRRDHDLYAAKLRRIAGESERH